MQTINFTAEKFKDFKRTYEKAKADDVKHFYWRGLEFDINYAKYLIEYLATRFGA